MSKADREIELKDLLEFKQVILDNIKNLETLGIKYNKEKPTPLNKRILRGINKSLLEHQKLLEATNKRILVLRGAKSNGVANPKNKKDKVAASPELIQAALNAYGKFHHRDDGKVKGSTIDYPDALVYVGTGKRLYYTSDKRLYGDEKMRNYYHDFKKHGEIYAGIKLDKNKKPYVDMFIIKDVDTRMKPEGIVG